MKKDLLMLAQSIVEHIENRERIHLDYLRKQDVINRIHYIISLHPKFRLPEWWEPIFMNALADSYASEIGHLVGWEVSSACFIAASILEEVNAHTEAEPLFREVSKLNPEWVKLENEILKTFQKERREP